MISHGALTTEAQPDRATYLARDCARAVEPLHGWAIARRLTQMSGGILQVSEGSLYPALHKLEALRVE